MMKEEINLRAQMWKQKSQRIENKMSCRVQHKQQQQKQQQREQ